jgi:small subunit ribosomal protein S20
LPNTRSAEKALRISERRHLRNKSTKSAVKTYVKRAEQVIAEGTDQAADAVRRAIQALDRAAEKDILHKNNAARRKSRLMKRLNALIAPPAPAETDSETKPAKAARTAKTVAKPAAKSAAKTTAKTTRAAAKPTASRASAAAKKAPARAAAKPAATKSEEKPAATRSRAKKTEPAAE